MSPLSERSFFPKRCNPQPSPQTAISGKATRRTPHAGPNIVKVSTMEAGPRSGEVMMNASSGPSPLLGVSRESPAARLPSRILESRPRQSSAWNRLCHPGKRSRRPLTACDEPLHTGGKYQPDSERARRIANKRRTRSKSRASPILTLSKRDSPGLPLLDTISVTITDVGREEVSFRAAGKFRRIFAA